jgi:ABC-type nitrate/sulfonate/bicarbonate transport system permease component
VSVRSRRTLRRSVGDFLLSGGVFVVLLAAWELAARLGAINPLFASSPSQIFSAGVKLAADGTLGADALSSGRVFLAGFVLAVVVGIPVGVLLGWFDLANRAFSPLVSAFYTTPRIALMALFIIWFGLGFGSKTALVFLSAVFPLIVNMQIAMLNVDADLKRVGTAYGASQWQLFRTIAWPLSMPFLVTGLRLALGRGLLGVVAAEVFGGSDGLGYLIEYAGSTFRTDMVFVGVIVIAVFGIIMDRSLYVLNRRVDSWRGSDA